MNVVIADDLINEPNEIISISLTKITPFLTLTSVDGEILVTDNDGEQENYCHFTLLIVDTSIGMDYKNVGW